MLKVKEIFLSIQGQGASTGYPTVFVILAGCNLTCNYCNTVECIEGGVEMILEQVADEIKSYDYKRVCITGGEPLLQSEIIDLLEILEEYEVNIETNGSIDLSQILLFANHRFTMDIKTPSSGQSDRMNFDNLNYLRYSDEIKVVVGSQEDYMWIKDILKNHYKRGSITLSPVEGSLEPGKLFSWILEDKLDVRFQAYPHKLVWIHE
jgi:7-carboxy-7-deazaguanine synthase